MRHGDAVAPASLNASGLIVLVGLFFFFSFPFTPQVLLSKLER